MVQAEILRDKCTTLLRSPLRMPSHCKLFVGTGMQECGAPGREGRYSLYRLGSGGQGGRETLLCLMAVFLGNK